MRSTMIGTVILSAVFALSWGQEALAAKAKVSRVKNDLARQVLAETNLARTNPRRYAGYLKEFGRRFVGKAYPVPGTANMVLTTEGKEGVDEAVEFLLRQHPLKPLSWSPGLAAAAADLAREQGASGELGHGDGGDIRGRVERHGSWRATVGENISYGPDTARQVVMGLIVDDAVPDRGHRKNIFNPAYATSGAACGPHPLYRTVCVADYAGGFRTR